MRGAGRRLRGSLGLLLAALVGLVGCTPPNNQLRPPKRPEEYVVPPEEDLRFSTPPDYPKDLLNKDNLIRPKDTTPGLPGTQGGGPNGLSVPGARTTSGRGY
jgi:hypothetical protein